MHVRGSLSLRLFLIILGGVVLAVSLTTLLAQRERAQAFGRFRLHAAISHFSDVVGMLGRLPAAMRPSTAAALPSDDWNVSFDPVVPDVQAKRLPELAWIMNQRLGSVAHVEAAWMDPVPECPSGVWRCRTAQRTVYLRLRFPDAQGLWLGFKRVRDRPPPYEQPGFAFGVALFIAILASVTWWAVRLALAPLRRLAQAAEAFGRDIGQPPMDEGGPVEVRRAARSFNAMQRQIREYMAERTQILAAVAHDLKTPLTRMQLRLEACRDAELKDRLRGDVLAMRALVDEGLALAGSLDTSERPQALDLGALLQSLADDAADAGRDVAYRQDEEPNPRVTGRPNALRRVFENLIDNAVKYGGEARVSARVVGSSVLVSVCDQGPGIPDDRLDDVLRPFVRLETSRCRETGGTGLGLAIATNLLKSHGASLRLRNRPQGGLEALVELPRFVPSRRSMG